MDRLTTRAPRDPAFSGLLPEAPATRRAPTGAPGLLVTPAVLELVARSAALPRGIAFLHLGPAECVASAFGVSVRVVEQARACLESAAERPLLLEVHAEALARMRKAPPVPTAPARPRGQQPEALIRDAEGHHLGVDFLVHGAFESVAVTFGVHPDAVIAARELLAARAVGPGAAPAQP
jgi:hypothetical protein